MAGPDDQQPGTEHSPDDIEAMIELKVKNAIEDTEIRLGQKIEAIVKEIGKSIKPLVDGEITSMLPNIVNQIGEQFKTKIEERASNPGVADVDGSDGSQANGVVGGALDHLLRTATFKDIIETINAFKQPTSGQQLAGQFGVLLKGMSLQQKLSTGALTQKDLEGAFGTPAQESG